MKKAVALGIAGLSGNARRRTAGRPGVDSRPIQPPLALQRIALGKLTLSMEPSLIFIGIGALFGMKVGLSMLLGLVINYGILAPRLIEEKIIHHAAAENQRRRPAATAAGGQGRADVHRAA